MAASLHSSSSGTGMAEQLFPSSLRFSEWRARRNSLRPRVTAGVRDDNNNLLFDLDLLDEESFPHELSHYARIKRIPVSFDELLHEDYIPLIGSLLKVIHDYYNLPSVGLHELSHYCMAKTIMAKPDGKGFCSSAEAKTENPFDGTRLCEGAFKRARPTNLDKGQPSRHEHLPSASATRPSASWEGHQKSGVTGIAYHSGSNKLYTGNTDGKVHEWDCHSGLFGGVIVDIGAHITSVVGKGDWLLTGANGGVHCLDVQTRRHLNLPVPAGQVCSLATSNDTVFAGLEGGSILAWKVDGGCFELPAEMQGHTSAVISMAVGPHQLFSGTVGGAIATWDLKTLQLINAFSAHAGAVTSLVAWDRFCLSCSLDGKIMVRDSAVGMKLVYTHSVEHGVLAMTGLADSAGRPVVVCSTDDGIIQWYELPYFKNTGVIKDRRKVWAIHPTSGGAFFTGDTTGEIRVGRC